MKHQIVDYGLIPISRLGPKLVPDVSTDVGGKVDIWRKKIDSIRIDVLTFGTSVNPSLSVTGLKVPKASLFADGQGE